MARHEGEEIRYTVCLQNGCWEGCILACHVKDGKLTAIDVFVLRLQTAGYKDKDGPPRQRLSSDGPPGS